jgi:hypothetical protein
MVNTASDARARGLLSVEVLVAIYVASVVATIVALAILTAIDPAQATSEAWGHAIVVAIFAIVLPLRLRAAQAGSHRAHTVVGVIAVALIAVNVMEAVIPGFVPLWMRIEMIATAALMAVVAALIFRKR